MSCFVVFGVLIKTVNFFPEVFAHGRPDGRFISWGRSTFSACKRQLSRPVVFRVYNAFRFSAPLSRMVAGFLFQNVTKRPFFPMVTKLKSGSQVPRNNPRCVPSTFFYRSIPRRSLSGLFGGSNTITGGFVFGFLLGSGFGFSMVNRGNVLSCGFIPSSFTGLCPGGSSFSPAGSVTVGRAYGLKFPLRFLCVTGSPINQ